MYSMVFEQNTQYQIVQAIVQDMENVWRMYVFVKVTGVGGTVAVCCVLRDAVQRWAEVVVCWVSVSATLGSLDRHAVCTEEIPQETGNSFYCCMF